MAKLVILLVSFIGAFLLPLCSAQGWDEVFVEAGSLGVIKGEKAWTSQTQKEFFSFHGIPNAESTDGENRFKPSTVSHAELGDAENPFPARDPLILCPQGTLPPEVPRNGSATIADVLKSGMWSSWSGTHNEKSSQNARVGETEGGCLVINVHTPKIPVAGDNEKFPVIFFIHGGSSTSVWGALFTAFRFLEKDVILVTINYRLGILGGFNLQMDDAPGNQAMYDTITALQWVNEYIGYFGGDKDKVTVYGHSAGSMMASHILLSPLANGLINGVIGASGSALAAWGTASHPSIDEHRKVARHAHCYSGIETDAEILECMKGADIPTLLSAMSAYSGDETRVGRLGFDPKVPSIQTDAITIPRFLTKTPMEILRAGEQNNVPLIMGATRHDGTFALDDVYEKYLKNYIDDPTFLRNDALPALFKALKVEDRTGLMSHVIGHTYFGDEMKTVNFWEMLAGFIDLTSVFGFKAPAYQLVEHHAKLNPNSYYYSFDYHGFWSMCDIGGSSDIPCGIGHIEDMMYTFQIFPLAGKGQELSHRMIEYFVNFAYYGNPNGASGNSVWPRYDEFEHSFISLGEEDKAEKQCRDTWIDNAIDII